MKSSQTINEIVSASKSEASPVKAACRRAFLELLERMRGWVEPHSLHEVRRTISSNARGHAFAKGWPAADAAVAPARGAGGAAADGNRLRAFFEAKRVGRGIWKWEHYFDIYQRHFSKFVGGRVSVAEIGIYSGGSLEMWQDYFGSGCTIHGIDIESACKSYEGGNVSVFIGDQADRSFWREFKSKVPVVDILIDDGGHDPEQQIVSLEEMLPHLRPGGVYLCEDVHGIHHDFAAYVSGLASHLNTQVPIPGDVLSSAPTEFQRAIKSIHIYPFVVVIERTESPVEAFVGPRHGTEWQPFL